MFKLTWLPGFQNIFYISFHQIWLISGLLSERISGDIYAVGHPAYAHYLLNVCSECHSSRSQLKISLKSDFQSVSCWGCTIFVRASIALISKSKTYLCHLYDFVFYFILFSFLFMHFITFWINYDVWYTVVLIDYLLVIHMKIPIQIRTYLIG